MVCKEFSTHKRREDKLVVVGSAQLIKRLPDISLSLLGKTISPVSVAKDLRVYIDQYLTHGVHVIKQSL